MRHRKVVGFAISFALFIIYAAIAAAQSGATQASPPGTIAKPPAGIVPMPALNPLDDIAWMKGGTWVAEVKDKDGNVETRIETRIRGSENGRLTKFTTTFISHNKPELHYEGIYAYDPEKKQIVFYYTDPDGNFTRGHAAFANGTLTQEFEIVHMNGQVDTLRSLVVRDGDNSYNWNVMSNKSGGWKELLHLRYVRERAKN